MTGGRFSYTTMKKVWNKAPTVPGRSPRLWRMDVNGREVFYPHRGLYGVTGWQVDHIIPPAQYTILHGPAPANDPDKEKYDPDNERNGQLLQGMANCRKKNKLLSPEELKRNASYITLTPALKDFLEISATGKIWDENHEQVSEILSVEEASHYFSAHAGKDAKGVQKTPLPYFLPLAELEQSLCNGLPMAVVARAIKIFGIHSLGNAP